MNLIGIAIGATGLLLLGTFIWMLVLQMRKKRLEQERVERGIAKRKALEKNRQQEEKRDRRVALTEYQSGDQVTEGNIRRTGNGPTAH